MPPKNLSPRVHLLLLFLLTPWWSPPPPCSLAPCQSNTPGRVSPAPGCVAAQEHLCFLTRHEIKLTCDQWAEPALVLLSCVRNEHFTSRQGNSLVSSVKSGSRTNRMKLVWEDGLDTWSRSMKGVTGRPLSFSVSLCTAKQEPRRRLYRGFYWNPNTGRPIGSVAPNPKRVCISPNVSGQRHISAKFFQMSLRHRLQN